jgi:hypothetical protein
MTSSACTSVHLTSLVVEVTDLGPMPTLSTGVNFIAQSAATTACLILQQSIAAMSSIHEPSAQYAEPTE